MPNEMTTKPLIGYIRVSTQKQGQSGLGAEAQHAAILAYGRPAKCYVEVETGKIADRPKLQLAIEHARRLNATLVIAKLDRLARNVAFVSALMESDVEFICCDNPHANRLTMHILAAVAEDEAERISQRTKDALAAYKARGGILGAARPECRNLTPEGRQRGNQRGSEATKQRFAKEADVLRPIIERLRQVGATCPEIAKALHSQGHKVGLYRVQRIVRELGIPLTPWWAA